MKKRSPLPYVLGGMSFCIAYFVGSFFAEVITFYHG